MGEKRNIKNNYFIILILNFFIFIIIYSFRKKNFLIKYKEYISKCKKSQIFKNKNLINYRNPYISICIPAYNMEKYIESSLLSIINQSFENFEIILVNDNSKDKTIDIVKRLQSQDNRIKILDHKQNSGVYSSRIEAILNAKGEYILLMDPDDMILNQNLFEELFNYNLKNQFDIIEFSVYHQKEERKMIYLPTQHEFNHNHGFKKNIIYQPELSNIIFYKPNSKNYSEIICRTIWNKLYRKQILIKTINYIEKDFHKKFLIAADDTPINMINFQFANNYSNIFLSGYLYNIRKNSITNGIKENYHLKIVSINYLLYYKLFYRYIKDFNKNLDYLYYDIFTFSSYLLNLKKLNISEYIFDSLKFFNKIINDKNISNNFKNFTNKLILLFK